MRTHDERNNEQKAAGHEDDYAQEQETGGMSTQPPPFQLKSGTVQTNGTPPIQRDNDIATGYRIIREQGLGASLRELWNYITEDDIEDAQEVIGNLDTGLERASQALGVAELAVSDPTIRRRIGAFKGVLERMQRYTSRALSAGEVYNNIRTFRELLDAIEDMPENVSDDPQAAADAFGRITSSLGTLGGLLPDGPWSGYFEFLAESRDFFSNMLHGVNVDTITEDRFRRQGLDPNDPGGTFRSTR